MKVKPKKYTPIAVKLDDKKLKYTGLYSQEPVNIFDAFDRNAYYVYHWSALEDINVQQEIIIFKFTDMQTALEFYRDNQLFNQFKHLDGVAFLEKYNFNILKARSFIEARKTVKLDNIASKRIKNNL